MELKRRFNWKRLFTILYIVAFLVYAVVGLHPVEARHYEVSGNLNIPAIGLNSDITTLELNDHRLETPDTIIGSYSKYGSKVLLIGHSTTVFKDLNKTRLGDYVYYNGELFVVGEIKTLSKGDIDMNMILAPTKNPSIIMMTCAGEPLVNHDATHRLIVTATKVFANE